MHAEIKDNTVITYPIENIRKHLSEISLPLDLTDNNLLPDGFVYVHQQGPATYNPRTHKAVAKQLPECVNGVWVIGYDIVPLSAEDIEAQKRSRLQSAKQARAAAVEAIIVTTSTGKSFNGDEISQTRMSRAIQGMQIAGANFTKWVLADNTAPMVTLAELSEALLLAGTEQTRLWVIEDELIPAAPMVM